MNRRYFCFLVILILLNMTFTIFDYEIQKNIPLIQSTTEMDTEPISSNLEYYKPLLPMKAPLIDIEPLSIDSQETDWNTILQYMGLQYLFDEGFTGRNIKVGIIDNGVDFKHPVFDNVLFEERSFAEQGFESTQTHGTSVAGMIIGTNSSTGSAPSVEIYSAEMGSDLSDSQILGNLTEAFEWLIFEKDVDIINTSWGGLLLCGTIY